MANSAKMSKARTAKNKLVHCVDWLQDQNSLNNKKLSEHNKNDIQFIIETNAARKKFLQSAAADDTSLPAGVDEPEIVKSTVPGRLLRVMNLKIECQWASCFWHYANYEQFQRHVQKHTADLHVIDKEGKVEYVCLWDVCGHNSIDFQEMVRHINYHAYHARLLAIGFNARSTLKLERCDKDSTKRNQLPPLKSEHICRWTSCDEKFNSIQGLFDHVALHIKYCDEFTCSWAGCGMTFTRRTLLTMHTRSHTGERLIACYHCGRHFACNRKLADHLRRQNPSSTYTCSVCGSYYASDYLLREHTRQHISMYACALCDMSAPTPATLATHVRYRHLPAATARHHACPHCDYRAVSISDLRRHLPTHTRKRKRSKTVESEADISDDDSSEEVEKRSESKPAKKYACHMCPEKNMKVFSRGTRLTTHLVQVHGAQWPFGHSRFRYQISEDGMYRLTTTRYEILEVSKKIVDGYSDPKESLQTSSEYDIKQVAEATETTPKRFEIRPKGDKENTVKQEPDNSNVENVEITVCDVDEHGNIINTEIIDNSDVVYEYKDVNDVKISAKRDRAQSC